jgi:hypothetical protein
MKASMTMKCSLVSHNHGSTLLRCRPLHPIRYGRLKPESLIDHRLEELELDEPIGANVDIVGRSTARRCIELRSESAKLVRMLDEVKENVRESCARRVRSGDYCEKRLRSE